MDANPTITYYRMRTEGTYDHTTDEKITENSIFAHEGEYLIYAVVGETDNYAELFTECATLTVKASGNHTHCLYGHKGCEVDYQLTYDGFNGSSLSPNGSKDQRSYYLNAAKSTVNLTLILRQRPADSSGETPSLLEPVPVREDAARRQQLHRTVPRDKQMASLPHELRRHRCPQGYQRR